MGSKDSATDLPRLFQVLPARHLVAGEETPGDYDNNTPSRPLKSSSDDDDNDEEIEDDITINNYFTWNASRTNGPVYNFNRSYRVQDIVAMCSETASAFSSDEYRNNEPAHADDYRRPEHWDAAARSHRLFAAVATDHHPSAAAAVATDRRTRDAVPADGRTCHLCHGRNWRCWACTSYDRNLDDGGHHRRDSDVLGVDDASVRRDSNYPRWPCRQGCGYYSRCYSCAPGGGGCRDGNATVEPPPPVARDGDDGTTAGRTSGGGRPSSWRRKLKRMQFWKKQSSRRPAPR